MPRQDSEGGQLRLPGETKLQLILSPYLNGPKTVTTFIDEHQMLGTVICSSKETTSRKADTI